MYVVNPAVASMIPRTAVWSIVIFSFASHRAMSARAVNRAINTKSPPPTLSPAIVRRSPGSIFIKTGYRMTSATPPANTGK